MIVSYAVSRSIVGKRVQFVTNLQVVEEIQFGNTEKSVHYNVTMGVTFRGNSAELDSRPTVGYLTPAKFQTISLALSAMENWNDSRRTDKTTAANKNE